MSAHANISGNLTADPELKITASGLTMCSFSLAYNPTKPDGTKGDPNFYDVVAWRDLASNFAASAKKGDRVLVMAQIRQNNWVNEAGDKRSRIQFNAIDIGMSCVFATVEATRTKNPSNGAEPVVDGEDIFAN